MATIKEIDKYCSLCMDINCTGCEYHDVHFRNIKRIDMTTIKWYKVKCSFYKQTIGFKVWQDIIDFMSKNIGFDYIIEGQYSEPFVGVNAYYDTKTKMVEKL